MESNIIVDGRVLGNVVYKNSARSGIYFSSINIIKNLKALHPIKLYADIKSYYILKKYFPEFELYRNENALYKMASYIFYLRAKSHSNSSNKLIRVALSAMALVLGKIFRPKGLDSKNAIFFSTFFAPPEDIREDLQIKKFLLLHDCIPLLFSDYFTPPPPANSLAKSLLALVRKKASPNFFLIKSLNV